MSLENTSTKMSKYDIILVCPYGLDVSGYKDYITKEIRFDASYFKSLNSYNDLMLSSAFYEKFCAYKYILLCQLDAYIFEDSLHLFTDLDYDYIGALHCTPYTGNKLLNGNGGFCLRKVESMIEASENIRTDLNNQWDWEDILYSYHYKDHLNLAPYNVCLRFGWQQNPENCYIENREHFPFGCHKPFVYGRNFHKFKFLLQ